MLRWQPFQISVSAAQNTCGSIRFALSTSQEERFDPLLPDPRGNLLSDRRHGQMTYSISVPKTVSTDQEEGEVVLSLLPRNFRAFAHVILHRLRWHVHLLTALAVGQLFK